MLTSSRLLACVMLFLLAGCGMFRRSSTWDAIEHAPIASRGDSAESEAYAQHLHALLSEKGIESKVIHFRYRVLGRWGVPGSITQSAVIYRNEATPEFPWWFMDNVRTSPLWLPNGTVQEQVRFAEKRHYFVEVTDEGAERALSENPKLNRNHKEAPQTEWKLLFKHVHGTSYDPASALDRRKMAELKRSRHPR